MNGALCQAHQCRCRALVEVNGLHGLSCKLGSGKHSIDASLNDIIYGACCRADIPAVKEPTGLTRTGDKRPNGSTLVPWSAGNFFLWTLRLLILWRFSYAAISSVSAELVAEQSFARKLAKYSELAISHIFVPIAMESLIWSYKRRSTHFS